MIREHSLQSIFAVFQCGIVIIGTACTAGMLKLSGYPDDAIEWPSTAVFIRNWGLLWLVVPLGWVVGTVYLERNREINFSGKAVVISGFIILSILFTFFLFVALRALFCGMRVEV